MNIFWGLFLFALSSIGYVGQVLTALRPSTATKLGLAEAAADVDPTFYADVRGEAYWDAGSLWTLPIAGVLLALDCDCWAYFGLVGGGMYLYFAGRGIVVRRLMQKRGIRVGTPENLRVNYVLLALWGVAAAITIGVAVAELSR